MYVIKDTILVYKSEEESWDRLGHLTVKDVAQAVADDDNIYITTKNTYELYRWGLADNDGIFIYAALCTWTSIHHSLNDND